MEKKLKEIEEKIQMYTDSVAGGLASDYAQYREMVGKISAWKEAKQMFLDLYGEDNG